MAYSDLHFINDNIVISQFGFDTSKNYFGGADNYSDTSSLSIEGTINELSNLSGIGGIWQNLSLIKNNIPYSVDFELYPGSSLQFPNSRYLITFFDAGTDVRTKAFRIQLESDGSGSSVPAFISGVSNLATLKGYSDGYSISSNKNNEVEEVSSASAQFLSGTNSLNAINAAKSFVSSIIQSAAVSQIGVSNSNADIKITNSESYDLISNEYSKERRKTTVGAGPEYQTSISVDSNGIINASETITIRDLSITGYKNTNFQSRIDGLTANSYSRLSSKVPFISSGQLIDTPVSYVKSIDLFNNQFSVSISYSNNSGISNGVQWNRVVNSSNSNGVTSVSEQGSVVGLGKEYISVFEQVKNYYKNTIDAQKFSRVNPYGINVAEGGFLKAQTQSFSPVKKTIDYSFDFTNEPVLSTSNGIKYGKMDVTDNVPLYQYTDFSIVNKGILRQIQNNANEGVRTANLQLFGDGDIPIGNYKAEAISQLNNASPIGAINTRLSDLSYSFNPDSKTANFVATWQYNLQVSSSSISL